MATQEVTAQHAEPKTKACNIFLLKIALELKYQCSVLAKTQLPPLNTGILFWYHHYLLISKQRDSFTVLDKVPPN